MSDTNICAIVRTMENEFTSGDVLQSKYVTYNIYENNNKIDAYYNSVHISGDTDALGREKPFFNIVVAAVNAWYRATDIDRKNINFRASKDSEVIQAVVAKILVQEWMRRNSFGVFLNTWGRILAKYGSSVVKFIEKGDKLHSEVVPWERLICDPIDFANNPKIERLYFTPAQLRKRKGYNREMVESLIEAQGTTRKDLNNNQKDVRPGYIEVYEVHGEFPVEMLTGKEEDSEIYSQQMHIVAFAAKKDNAKEYDDFTLYSGPEEKDPYMITNLIDEDGRVTGKGAVESLFEPQWMVNHNAKMIKDQLDMASLLLFQTSDGGFLGQNFLNSMMQGQVLIHKPNEPLTQLNNGSHDIGTSSSILTLWKNLAQEIVSTPDAMLGMNQPAGSAWRQTESLQAEAHSLFELMTENKGLAIENMMRTYVLPFIKRTMLKNKDQISGLLDSEGIKKINTMYLNSEATRRYNKKVLDAFLNDKQQLVDEMSVESESAQIEKEMLQFGSDRFIKPDSLDEKTWDEFFKDFEWDVEVDVTGEQRNVQEAMTTLTTILKTVANDPDKFNLVFNKILRESNIVSPVEMQTIESKQQNTQPQDSAQMQTQTPIGGA